MQNIACNELQVFSLILPSLADPGFELTEMYSKHTYTIYKQKFIYTYNIILYIWILVTCIGHRGHSLTQNEIDNFKML